MAVNGKSSVSFDASQLDSAIKDYDRKFQRLILGEMIYQKGEAVSSAKQNAPWTDDTGNARAGLFAVVSVTNGGKTFELIMAHSVPYGIWLEVRFSGRYAIIIPTLNVIGAVMLQNIQGLIAEATS